MPSTLTTFAEIIDSAMFSHSSEHYHILPGKVVTYYPDKQEADVQIAIDDPRFDPDTDELVTEKWPIYPRMRVVWPRFGGFTICGPVNSGDVVQVFFQDLDDSKFRSTGQSGAPDRTRRFGSDSAFCLPWDMTDAGVATDHTAAGSALIIGKDGSPPQIRINGTNIQLGHTGADFVALASLVSAELAKIVTTLATGSTPPGGGVVTFGTPYVPGSVASTLVKSD